MNPGDLSPEELLALQQKQAELAAQGQVAPAEPTTVMSVLGEVADVTLDLLSDAASGTGDVICAVGSGIGDVLGALFD